MGSNSGYTVQAQLRYIIQWFHEWSEMQRSDFLPVLAQKFVPSGYVNGLVSGLDALSSQDDKPPSLFQCRVKLFHEWSESWGPADREQLLSQIKAADSDFASRFEEELKSASQDDTAKAVSPDIESLESVEHCQVTEEPLGQLV